MARKLVDLQTEEEVGKTTSNHVNGRELACMNSGVEQIASRKVVNDGLPNLLGRSNYERTYNKKIRKLTREELVIPEFFKNYEDVQYSQACKISKKVLAPTSILVDFSLETLKRYTFVLSEMKTVDGCTLKYIEVDFSMVFNEVNDFLNTFPIFPSNMAPYKQRWFETQYMLILHEECLRWSRKIKNEARRVNSKSFSGLDSNSEARKLINSSLEMMKYPSIQKILGRICKRAIVEFFDAKRSSLIKICEGDFTVSAPLNLRILSYTDKTVIDESNDANMNRIIVCTDGWYIVKLFTNFTVISSVVKVMPRNIFVCGGNWLSSTMEHGHPLEIEASSQDFPRMVYGINLIRPIRGLSGFKLGFHLKPLLFRLSKLVNTLEAHTSTKELKNNVVRQSYVDKGGGVSFLVQVMVLHTFPMCYREILESEEEEGRRIFITMDQSEMDISMNNEIYEMYENSLQQQKSESEDSPKENVKRRRISIESKLLVLDYWKFMRLREQAPEQIGISDLINSSSILTLPSGVDVDEIASIRPGTVIRLSWMKVVKSNTGKGLECSFSRLIPSPKTSLSAKRRIKDSIFLDKILEIVRRPALTFEDCPEKIIGCKGGWPISLLGVILQVYPIEERRRGFEHCFEFKVLLLTPTGSKVFVRVHTTGPHESELRMCERASNKLRKPFKYSGEPSYKDFIVLIENTEFQTFERSTNLYYFNAKVPYSLFTTPYSLGERHFSDPTTRKALSKVINDLSFYTKCDIPKLFDSFSIVEDTHPLPICTNCENQLSECSCITDELTML
ncbi:BCRT domain-containing protein [Cryptosporidium canis]|nr:BCRT domain-containing protein [Cryptosporidium canis]